MANITIREDKGYVAKVSLTRSDIEFIKYNDFDGRISSSPNKNSMGMSVQAANRVAAYQNSIYGELGLDFECYVVRTAETNVHLISDVPSEYKSIVEGIFAKPVEPEPAPEETDGSGEEITPV